MIFNRAIFSRKKLRVVMQSELAECGLACLAMILSYYGYEEDLAALRRRFGVSRRGVRLTDLVAMSQACSLDSNPLRVDVEELGEVEKPCILHWNLNHFVVLHSYKKERAIIYDPAEGIRMVSRSELSRSFTGVALYLSPSIDFKKKARQKSERKSLIAGFLGTHARSLIPLLLLGFAGRFVALSAPLVTQLIFDDVVVNKDTDLLVVVCAALACLGVLRIGIGAVRSYFEISYTDKVSRSIDANIFEHLLTLPVEFFKTRWASDIFSRFQSAQSLRTFVIDNLLPATVRGICIFLYLPLMFYYNVKLGILSLVMGVGGVLIDAAYPSLVRSKWDEAIAKEARKSGFFFETARAIETVKALAQEVRRSLGWRHHLRSASISWIDVRILQTLVSTFRSLWDQADYVLTIYFAYSLLSNGDMSAGMVLAFLSFRSDFVDCLKSVADAVSQARVMTGHMDRLADISDAKPETYLDSLDGSKEIGVGSVTLEGVSYRHGEADPYVFSNVDLSILPGQTVAITGPSGSGKSTLLRIIASLYLPSVGKVSVDGVPINAYGLRNYRRQIACVLQDDQLVGGSVADNICFFADKPDFYFMEECAKKANIHEDINKMPMAYNTLIGEGGSGFSGGQRQRILLARALYQRPKILLLDESTSHVDVECEKLINSAIKSLNVTKVIVAHREETIRSCDIVYELKDGCLVKVDADLVRGRDDR